MKAKDLVKRACKNTIKRQRETKEYWDKKMEEVKQKQNKHYQF